MLKRLLLVTIVPAVPLAAAIALWYSGLRVLGVVALGVMLVLGIGLQVLLRRAGGFGARQHSGPKSMPTQHVEAYQGPPPARAAAPPADTGEHVVMAPPPARPHAPQPSPARAAEPPHAPAGAPGRFHFGSGGDKRAAPAEEAVAPAPTEEQLPVAPPVASAPPATTPPDQGPGEFTRIFRTESPAPVPRSPAPSAPSPEGAAPAQPPPLTDRVHFSVTAPPVLAPAAMAELSIWAHLDTQRAEALRRAAEQFGAGGFRTESKGPVRVERGTVLTIRLKVDGIAVKPREDTVLWEGEIGRAGFLLQVPADAPIGPRAALATVHIAGVRVLRLDFAILIGPATVAAPAPVDAQETRVRRAFASYAHEDRDAVLARIQGIQKAAPELDVFLDVANLRSGDHWQERLREEILRRDLLYLFWSRAASASTWVDWEWHCALRERGIDFIDPVPLVRPDDVPPPPELGGTLHFNDWVLAYMS